MPFKHANTLTESSIPDNCTLFVSHIGHLPRSRYIKQKFHPVERPHNPHNRVCADVSHRLLVDSGLFRWLPSHWGTCQFRHCIENHWQMCIPANGPIANRWMHQNVAENLRQMPNGASSSILVIHQNVHSGHSISMCFIFVFYIDVVFRTNFVLLCVWNTSITAANVHTRHIVRFEHRLCHQYGIPSDGMCRVCHCLHTFRFVICDFDVACKFVEWHFVRENQRTESPQCHIFIHG